MTGRSPASARRLRVPTLDDLEAVLALMNDPASVHNREDCAHGRAPEGADQLYDRLREDDNLVLEEAGEVVAYASWQWFGRHAHLNVMAVAGRRQRSGLGTALFEAFLAALAADRAVGVSLRAYADSPWAINFYARHGMAVLDAGTAWAQAEAGLRHYLTLAAESRTWPSTEKVLFYRRLST